MQVYYFGRILQCAGVVIGVGLTCTLLVVGLFDTFFKLPRGMPPRRSLYFRDFRRLAWMFYTGVALFLVGGFLCALSGP